MTQLSAVAAAFAAWMHAEAASHYASGCPDEVMSALVDTTGDRVRAIAALPSADTEDALLKAFMLLVIEFEPRRGDPPLTPKLPEPASAWPEAILPGLLADLARLSPPIAEALAMKHYSEVR